MTKKSKRHTSEEPDAKPYIVYNEYLQVWIGLREGGRSIAFSDDYDDAKPLKYEEQFKCLQRLTTLKLEKEYI